MNKKVETLCVEKLVLWDAVLIGVLYLVPTLSHISNIPLYRFEPMRCVLLLNLLITGNIKNSYVMAVTLPLFSFIVGGHPVFIKMILMAIELSVNIYIFELLSKRMKKRTVEVMFIAIIASKMLYYLLKYFVIIWGILDIPFIATDLFIQLVVSLILSLLFCKFQNI